MNPERYLHNKVPQLDQSEEVKTSIDKENRLRKAKSDKQEDLNIEERDSLKAVQNNPEARIEVYMKRLENIFLNKDKSTRDRNLQLLRPHILDAFIIKPEQVPESYFELQKRIARERGQAIDEIPTSVREQMIKTIIEEQTASLDNWMNYLTSSDAVYPTWFKYFAFRNITKLSQFDKERGEYKKRTDSTVAPFPDIYRESLAIVCDELESAIKSADKSNSETRATLDAKFPNLYATETNRSLELSLENRENIEGEWITYHQESTNSHHNNNEDNEDNGGSIFTGSFSIQSPLLSQYPPSLSSLSSLLL